MDADRFDGLIRSIVTVVPRRMVARGALAASFASLLTRLRNEDVAAKSKKKKRKKKCKGGKKKCGKKCILKTECCGGCGAQLCCGGTCADCCADTDCPTDATCVDGACVCPAGQAVCEETCVFIAADPANCGACGNVCGILLCFHGACGCGVTLDDCPEECSCLPRKQGGNACVGGLTEQPCGTDDECPLGSICLATFNTCSVPCLG